jgi:predicted nucleic acid-binding protein
MILLDTNVLSAIMRIDKEPAVLVWLDRQDVDTFFVPALVVFEIEYGIACVPSGRDRRTLKRQRTPGRIRRGATFPRGWRATCRAAWSGSPRLRNGR